MSVWRRGLAVLAFAGLAACQSIPYERTGVLPPPVVVADASPERAALNARTYDAAVGWVEKLFYAKDFHGVDFAAEAAARRAEAIAQPDEAGFYGALEALVDKLDDDHTQTLSPTRRERIAAGEAGDRRPGYGMVMMPRGDDRYVSRVRPDTPASAAGVQVGWKVETVNGVPPRFASPAQEGKADTVVFLDETGERHTVALTPVPLDPLPRTEARRLEGDIAYIRFDDFDRETYDWYKAEFAKLADAPPAGLIIDLRTNGGGSLALTGMSLSWLFDREIDFGVTTGRFINRRYSSESPDRPYLGPVVMIVGPGSASGGELYPAVAQELKRAVIVGERTRGAVIGSRAVELPDGGAIRIGIFDMTTPGGARLEKVGVIPDVPVDIDWSALREERDPALAVALTELANLAARTTVTSGPRTAE
ncbi:S41 family peptidase [Brevundimonas sp. NIBR10]|uniref:S41 family peptidase n=1 Tax=Brevundimonas sp. NIBR10 TaxID=3015997 RepID=UPI0022F18C99|nr:S41 family peptidase [Brevundimonas sp. NIBR10]